MKVRGKAGSGAPPPRISKRGGYKAAVCGGLRARALLPGRLLPWGLARGMALKRPLLQVVVLVQRVLPGD